MVGRTPSAPGTRTTGVPHVTLPTPYEAIVAGDGASTMVATFSHGSLSPITSTYSHNVEQAVGQLAEPTPHSTSLPRPLV